MPVDQHSPHIAGRVLGLADQPPPPPETDQGFLGQFLCLGWTAGQGATQPAQPGILAGEELAELAVIDGHEGSPGRLPGHITPGPIQKVPSEPNPHHMLRARLCLLSDLGQAVVSDSVLGRPTKLAPYNRPLACSNPGAVRWTTLLALPSDTLSDAP